MASDNSIADTVWSSRLGFILASASSAIGLGAIWKFPFWAGTNGGAAFIVPFLVFTFTIGIVWSWPNVPWGEQAEVLPFMR